MTDTSMEQIRRFLAQPENLEIFTEISSQWSKVRADIVRRFADRLTRRISARLRDQAHLGDLQCRHSLTSDGDQPKYESAVIVSRPGGDWSIGKHRVFIGMEAQRPGAEDWVIGVFAGEQREEFRAQLRRRLSDKVGPGKKSDGYPWYQRVSDNWRFWNRKVPALARELETDGDATRYFVEQFARICEEAVPIIDEEARRHSSL